MMKFIKTDKGIMFSKGDKPLSIKGAQRSAHACYQTLCEEKVPKIYEMAYARLMSALGDQRDIILKDSPHWKSLASSAAHAYSRMGDGLLKIPKMFSMNITLTPDDVSTLPDLSADDKTEIIKVMAGKPAIFLARES